MATAIKFTDSDIEGDVIRRGIKRNLPCDLTDAEFMQIAKQRVDKEALLDQLQADFDKLKAKHKAAVDELDGEIGKARKELHTGQQDRTVLCVEVFRRAEDGTGWVHLLRMDTLASEYADAVSTGTAAAEARTRAAEFAAVERRPASPTEAQRYLPGVEGMPVDRAAPLLDQAAAAQASGRGDPEPDDGSADDEDGDVPEDDGLTELTPAQVSAREAADARKARRTAGAGKRGGKGKAK